MRFQVSGIGLQIKEILDRLSRKTTLQVHKTTIQAGEPQFILKA